jgi:hypothetical protein
MCEHARANTHTRAHSHALMHTTHTYSTDRRTRARAQASEHADTRTHARTHRYYGLLALAAIAFALSMLGKLLLLLRTLRKRHMADQAHATHTRA